MTNKTCMCQFEEGGREYTYRTAKSYAVGDTVYAEVGADDIKRVRVVEMHDSDRRDQNARFEYRWVLGTPMEVREAMARLRSLDESAEAAEGSLSSGTATQPEFSVPGTGSHE